MKASTKALIFFVLAVIYGFATSALIYSKAHPMHILVGMSFTALFLGLWRRASIEAWDAASSAAVQPAEPVAEKPREPITKKCPPHKWEVLEQGGHKCTLCPYKAGT